MNAISNWLGVLLLLVIEIGVLFVLPVWLLASGISRLRHNHGGKIRLSMAAASLLFTLFVLDSFSGPWHEKILDKGSTPDGRQYALFQIGAGEPFEVRLYVRSEQSGWVFHYVDHEVFPWRFGGHVEFAPDSATAQVFKGSKVYRTIDILPPEKIGSSPEPFSPTNSPEDLLLSFYAH